MLPLALTMGDPAGIAPEITLKAWQGRSNWNLPPFFVIGDPVLYNGAKVITSPAQASEVFKDALPVLPLALKAQVKPGVLDSANAPVVLESIRRGVAFCDSGEAFAIVTNPIHKSVLKKSGLFDFPGHTEYLAYLTKSKTPPVMMLAAKDLRVVPLTIHMALKDVPKTITENLICATGRTIHAALGHPRIAVAGLNPHAGEEGAFGTEEIEIIAPAIERLKKEGLNISGPHSGDTLFHADMRKTYDIALCMYHDQALIPLKTLDFHGGGNVTLGLPIIRTSPDHGTALGIAGQGVANPQSLVQALLLAESLARKG